jgi:hypothetical protein
VAVWLTAVSLGVPLTALGVQTDGSRNMPFAPPATSKTRSSGASARDLEWPHVVIKDVYTRDAAKRSLTRAHEWLAKPECQSLFSEFRDEHGIALIERVHDLTATVQSYLQLVYFFDGEQNRVCKRDGVLAFTERGSRVIYLCGRDFERASHRNPPEVQATLIHEVLHSLGLGENPPSPRFITDRVRRLCE